MIGGRKTPAPMRSKPVTCAPLAPVAVEQAMEPDVVTVQARAHPAEPTVPKSPAPKAVERASLVAAMRPALVAFFQRRCRNVAEAEDLAQDVVVRALAHAKSLSPEQASGYIFRIAVNRWRDRGRRLLSHGSCVAWDEKSALAVSDAFSPERVACGQQELGNVVSALQELGERTRDVLVLCRLEQMKQAEIATAMGISVSSVEKHLVRALAHLARHADVPRPTA